MIICNCRAASERDVRAAIDRGAACLSELERCGIGGDCGSCTDMLRAMLRRSASQHSNVPTSQPTVIPSPA